MDAIFTQWSSFEELRIDFDDNLMKGVPNMPVVQTSAKDKEWRDVWRIGVGVEYAATDWLDLRAICSTPVLACTWMNGPLISPIPI